MKGLNLADPRLLAWLAIILAIGGVVYLLSPILAPFLAGAILAYMLNPLVARIARSRVRRTIAVVCVLFLVLLAVVALLLIVLPLFSRELRLLSEKLPEFINWLNQVLVPWLSRNLGIQMQFDFGAMRQMATKALQTNQDLLLGLLGSLQIGGMALVGVLVNLLLIPVVLFYLLRDWDSIVAKLDEFLPRKQAPTIRRLAREVDDVLAAFVRGQVMVCLVMAIYYATVLSLIGLDFGLLVGAVSGMITFIPFIGAIVAFVLSMGIGLVQFLPNPWPLAGILGMYVVAQVVEGNVLTPKLVGDRVGLHPVWVIFAMLAGGSLFGFVGVLLALPVAAAAGVLVRYALERYRESKLYYGPDG